jgi:adenosylcobinamide-phosphate synthase
LIAGEHLALLAAALVLDAIAGRPDWLWRRIPHPVTVMGAVFQTFDRAFNRSYWPRQRLRIIGGVTVVLLVLLAALVGWLLESIFRQLPFGWIGTLIVAAVMIAGRSLHDHMAAVAMALDDGGVEAGRRAIARILGRDPGSLDRPRISRAAIESAAENFSAGVVAPAFWFALLGLPGLLACEAINAAGSTIGHLSLQHRDFGWAAARLEESANLPASRLAGALIALAAPFVRASIGRAFRVMRRDAPRHRSPNAGWPEAAMAAATGVSLGGPRRYGGILVDDVYLNESGRRDATPDDIRCALRVYRGAWAMLAILVTLLAVPFFV